MRVFFTGATGVIGSALARDLCGRGDDVVACVDGLRHTLQAEGRL